MPGRSSFLWGALGFTWISSLVNAQESLPPPEFEEDRAHENSSEETVLQAEGISLADYFDALSSERLLGQEEGNDRRFQDRIRLGEALYFAGRFEQAMLVLFEVAESPQFSDFQALDEFSGSDLILASSLAELGSLRSAARYLERILRRGVSNPYFAPAYRRFVDVILESGELTLGTQILESLGEDVLPSDAENELRYLHARKEYDRENLDVADRLFEMITRRSRFFANAQYFRGVIAARKGDLQHAEERFCSIATTDDQTQYTFYVDERYFQIKDLAWLGLGRVAHEGRRSDDAFYYYFHVPNDSERVAEALFESAFAMYEGEQHDTAVDLLDQLEVRFPSSPFVDEAMLLRGYVHLARCEFEEANELFLAFQRRFFPLLTRIERMLESPIRRRNLYRELLEDERHTTTQTLLVSLLRVDPLFFSLHSRVQTLDAEAARSGRLLDDLRGLSIRLGGQERPRTTEERQRIDDEIDELRVELEFTRESLFGLVKQLDELREAGASRNDLRSLETEIRQFTVRIDELGGRLREQIAAQSRDISLSHASRPEVESLLQRDAQMARQRPRRIVQLRQRLVRQANRQAFESLRNLRDPPSRRAKACAHRPHRCNHGKQKTD